MKTAVIAAAVIVACATTATAQEMTAGVKVGYNNTKLWFDEDETGVDARTRVGLVAGVFTNVALTPRVAFQPEFLYSQKGSKLRSEGEESALRINYFEIPLLADIRLNSGANRVSLMVGPTLGFRLKAESEFNGVTEDLTEEPDDQVEKNDYGFTAGLALTMNQFVIDGRYTWGLRNLNVDKTDPETTMRTLSVTVGWRFR